MLVPAGLGAAAIVAVAPWATWVIFAAGWMLFPVVGLLVGGLGDLARTATVDLDDLAHAASVHVRRAVAALAAPAAPGAAGAALAAARRIEADAATLAEPGANAAAGAVAAAAARVAHALEGQPAEAAWVNDRFLDPAAAAVAAFARLAAPPAGDADPALVEVVDRDLPRLAARLDDLARWLDDDGVSSIPSGVRG